MLRRNININNAGKVSCLLLLLLIFSAVNPVAGSAYADEITEEKEASDAVTNNTSNADADVMTTALVTSKVQIGFSPSSGSTNLSPTTSAGQSAQINVLATVDVSNSGGYSVYLKSNTQNLVGQTSPTNVIPGISGETTYDNLATNTWGYYASEGTAVPEGALYKAISVTGNGDKIAENTNETIFSDTKKITLSFVAKIGNDKPADTYQNTVTMSVVSSPRVVAEDFGIDQMQEMTTAICSNAKDVDGDGVISGQLKDARDGKYYWVSKLADGKCWMTQNLDLNLSKNKTLTSNDSDITSDWTPSYDTATTANASTILASNTGQRSWDLGDYKITDPTASSDCSAAKNDLSQCSKQFTPFVTPITRDNDTDAHYIAGNYYQWNAATAGTGNTIAGGQAQGSICPKGWKLPTSNTNAAGSFGGLINAYSIGKDVSKLTSAPLYFVRAGRVYQDTTNMFGLAGAYGRYWSSTAAASGDTNAHNLNFHGTNVVEPSNSYTRQYGFSIRCLAR